MTAHRSKKRYYSLNIPIAHKACRLNFNNYYDFKRFKKHYYSFPLSTSKCTSFTIDFRCNNEKFFNPIFLNKYPYKQTIVHYPSRRFPFRDLSVSLSKYLQYLLIPYDILLIHASSIIKVNKAYVFCGPSGVGKSTLIRQVSRNNILSNDTTVIRKIGKKFFVCQSAFDHRKHPYHSHRHVALAKFFFLKKGNATKIRNVSFVESVNQLFYNTNII